LGVCVLRKVRKEVRQCYARAEAARQEAEAAFSNEIRDDLLDLEESWLKLARSYEFAEGGAVGRAQLLRHDTARRVCPRLR
jgi:uncharacterized membrane protein